MTLIGLYKDLDCHPRRLKFYYIWMNINGAWHPMMDSWLSNEDVLVRPFQMITIVLI